MIKIIPRTTFPIASMSMFEMLKNTKELDVDFMRNEIKEAQLKIKELQKEFDSEYEYQQS